MDYGFPAHLFKSTKSMPTAGIKFPPITFISDDDTRYMLNDQRVLLSFWKNVVYKLIGHIIKLK